MKSKPNNEPHAQREKSKKESKVGSTQPNCATRADTSHLINTSLNIPRANVLRGKDLDSNAQNNTSSDIPLVIKKGWLKNGNPPGDPTKSPRCGAHARRTCKPCQQPAMANGKCRLHGGLSTGPKTQQGLARSRKANWKHGEYSREFKEEMHALRQGMTLFLNPDAILNMTPTELHTQKVALERLMNKLQRRALMSHS